MSSTFAEAASSGGVLAGVLKILKTGLTGIAAAMAANPLLVAAAGVSAALVALNAYDKKQSEIRQQAIQTGKEAAQNTANLRDLYNQYKEARSNGSAEQLQSATTAICSALGIEESQVNSLVAAYGSLDAAITKVTADKNTKNKMDLSSAYTAAQGELVHKAQNGEGFLNPFQSYFRYTDKLSKKVQEAAGIGTNDNGAFNLKGDTATVEGVTKMYDDIISKEQAFEKAIASGEVTREEVTSSKVYQALEKSKSMLENEHSQLIEAQDNLNNSIANQLYGDYVNNNGIPKTQQEFDAMRQSMVESAKSSGEFVGGITEIGKSIDGVLSSTSGLEDFWNAYSTKMSELSSDDLTKNFEKNKDIFSDVSVSNMDKYLDAYREYMDVIENGTTGEKHDSIAEKFKGYADSLGVTVPKLRESLKEVANFEDWTNSLSSEDKQLVYNIQVNEDTAEWKLKDWKAALEDAQDQQKMEFTIDIASETTGLSNLNSALSESTSATGLTADAISNLEDRYSSLENYDAAELFDNTATGVRVNRDALQELEKEYENVQNTGLEEKLDTLNKKYKESKDELSQLTPASNEYFSKLGEVRAYEDQISAAEQLKSQYEGLTNAYNDWQNTLNSGNDRDGFENVANGYEEAGKKIEQGWLGDDSLNKYLDLMLGDNRTKDVEKDYESLSNTIKGTSNSLKDYFTFDEDGTMTSEGVEKFFDDVQSVAGKGFTSINEEGEKTLDLTGENVEKLADKFGTSTEAITLMGEALEDAGYNVEFDEAGEGVSDLVTNAQSALESLNEITDLDLDINFQTENIDEIDDAMAKIQGEFSNSDGTFNINAEGADEALSVLEALNARKTALENPVLFNVDTSSMDSATADAVTKLQTFQMAVSNLELQQSLNLDTSEAQAQVQAAASDLEGLDPEIKARVGIDSTDVTSALSSITNTDIKAKVNVDTSAINTVKTSIQNLSGTAIINYQGKYPENAPGIKGEADYTPGIFPTSAPGVSGTATYTGSFPTSAPSIYGTAYYKKVITGDGDFFNGTAHAQGTAYASGTHGDWGVKQNQTSLINELGKEIIVRNGHWFTVNNGYPAYTNLKRGDIVFNHKQSEELLKKGYVTNSHAKVVGGAFNAGTASGAAFASGSSKKETFDFAEIKIDRLNRAIDNLSKIADSAYKTIKQRLKASTNEIKQSRKAINANDKAQKEYRKQMAKVNLSSNMKKKIREGAIDVSKYGDKTAEKIKDYQEWYEKLLKCRDASRELKQSIAEVYQGKFDAIIDEYESRLDLVDSRIKKYDAQIDYYEAKSKNTGQKYYSEQKDELSKKLDDQYENLYTAESEVEELQKRLEKAMSAKNGIKKGTEAWRKMKEEIQDAEANVINLKTEIEETTYELSNLNVETFNDISEVYDNRIDNLDHISDMWQNEIDLFEAKGYLGSTTFYDNLVNVERQKLELLESELSELLAQRDKAIAEGVRKYSDEWWDMTKDINSVSEAISKANIQISKFQESLKDLDWDRFDFLLDRISTLNTEAEFLIDLFGNDLTDEDNGGLNADGNAVMGLRAINYNAYLAEAQKYRDEYEKISSQLSSDPYNTDLIERRQKLLELQQKAIISAEKEKDAMIELAKDGLESQADAIDDLIDKYKSALENAKDLFDYQRKINDASSEISSLEKQILAYENDDSEETRATIQKLRADLKDKREDLRDTEYSQFISDAKKLLDQFSDDYQDAMDERIDSVTVEIEELISQVNNNSKEIATTISEKVSSVGYTLSDEFDTILNSVTGVVSTFNNEFGDKNSGVVSVVKNIESEMKSIISGIESIATAKSSDDNANTGDYSEPVIEQAVESPSNQKSVSTENLKSGATFKGVKKLESITNTSRNGKIEVGDRVKFKSGYYFSNSSGSGSKGKNKLGDYVYISKIKKGANYPYRISKNKNSGALGWIKKKQISGYSSGGMIGDLKKIAKINGDDSITLNTFKKGEGILTDMQVPAIRDLVKSVSQLQGTVDLTSMLGKMNGDISGYGVKYDIGNVEFNIPIDHVENYDDIINHIIKDPKAEKLFQSITLGAATGKSSLTKNKYRR